MSLPTEKVLQICFQAIPLARQSAALEVDFQVGKFRDRGPPAVT